MRSIFLVCLFFFGCTPLHERFPEEVQLGDPASKVRDAFGDPDVIKQHTSTVAYWGYLDSGAICGVMLRNDVVINRGCDTSNYVSPGRRAAAVVGILLQGAGQGLLHAQDNSYSCTDQGGGYYSCWYQGRHYTCTNFNNVANCY